MSTSEGSICVCRFWDLETFGFKETKYIDLKRPELQRYLVFNFCKQEFRFPSILSLDNWLPAAKGSVCFLLLGPNHPPQVPFLSWPCPHHPQNCSYHPRIVSVSRVLYPSNALSSWGSLSSLRFRRIRNVHQISMGGCALFSYFWRLWFSCY